MPFFGSSAVEEIEQIIAEVFEETDRAIERAENLQKNGASQEEIDAAWSEAAEDLANADTDWSGSSQPILGIL